MKCWNVQWNFILAMWRCDISPFTNTCILNELEPIYLLRPWWGFDFCIAILSHLIHAENIQQLEILWCCLACMGPYLRKDIHFPVLLLPWNGAMELFGIVCMYLPWTVLFKIVQFRCVDGIVQINKNILKKYYLLVLCPFLLKPVLSVMRLGFQEMCEFRICALHCYRQDVNQSGEFVCKKYNQGDFVRDIHDTTTVATSGIKIT